MGGRQALLRQAHRKTAGSTRLSAPPPIILLRLAAPKGRGQGRGPARRPPSLSHSHAQKGACRLYGGQTERRPAAVLLSDGASKKRDTHRNIAKSNKLDESLHLQKNQACTSKSKTLRKLSHSVKSNTQSHMSVCFGVKGRKPMPVPAAPWARPPAGHAQAACEAQPWPPSASNVPPPHRRRRIPADRQTTVRLRPPRPRRQTPPPPCPRRPPPPAACRRPPPPAASVPATARRAAPRPPHTTQRPRASPGSCARCGRRAS
jgi:hypothetical protein